MAPYKRKRILSATTAYRGLKRGRLYLAERSRPGSYGRYAGRNAELKFHDVDIDDAVIDAGGTILNAGTINIIPQGVTEKQRIGRKCVIKEIHWRYQLVLPEVVDAASPAPPDTVRLILFLDQQCNKLTAAVLDILESADYQSWRNLVNSGRFRVLLDKTFALNFETLTSTQNADTFDHAAVTKSYVFNKLCNIPLEFNAELGVLTEICCNNLAVLAISQNGVAALNSKIRLRFSDGS